jgi:mono/diheme cytochrome c family protein
MVLRIAPAKVGDNELGVDVTDNRPGAQSAQPQVLLRFSLIGRNIGVTQVEAKSNDGRRFTARGTYLTLGGDWQAEIILRKPGFDDVVHRFTVPIGGAINAAVAVTGTPEPDFPNPVQPDSSSIAAGKALYAENCVPCHGQTGKGDGPVGLTLNPRPADLTYHTQPGVHTDGQLYLWITNGYPQSVMPAFGKYLSDTDRWNLVNYIRTLAQQQ